MVYPARRCREKLPVVYAQRHTRDSGEPICAGRAAPNIFRRRDAQYEPSCVLDILPDSGRGVDAAARRAFGCGRGRGAEVYTFRRAELFDKGAVVYSSRLLRGKAAYLARKLQGAAAPARIVAQEDQMGVLAAVDLLPSGTAIHRLPGDKA